MLVAVWLLIAGVGAGVMAWPGETVERALDSPAVLVASGVLTCLAALIAAAGVFLRLYRWELVASAVVLLGVAPYVLSVLFVLIATGAGAVRTGTAVGLLVLFPLTRLVRCWGESARLRALIREG